MPNLHILLCLAATVCRMQGRGQWDSQEHSEMLR